MIGKGKRATTVAGAVPGWAGVALLALWLGFIIPAFGQFRPTATDDPAAAGEILDWLRATGQMRPGTATAYRMPAPACRCGSAPVGAAWPAVAAGLSDAAVDIVDLSALAAPSVPPYELLVLDGDARLVYAGPLGFGAFCGASTSVAGMVPGMLATPGPPYVSTTHCRC